MTSLTSLRRFGTKLPGARRAVNLPDDHFAFVEARSFFPSRVFHASVLQRVLKSGYNSSKIGKVVQKGRWAKMPIFTLTLEERATCPRSCEQWRDCYGRGMPYAQRIIHDDAFENRLAGELEALNAQHPSGFVVRLHILGDFYAPEYVDFWEGALLAYPALRVFGYTARSPFDDIGSRLFQLTTQQWDRFAIRFSGGGFSTLCAEVVDHVGQTGNVICPAQTAKTLCCATCGLCWQSQRTIAFLRH